MTAAVVIAALVVAGVISVLLERAVLRSEDRARERAAATRRLIHELSKKP